MPRPIYDRPAAASILAALACPAGGPDLFGDPDGPVPPRHIRYAIRAVPLPPGQRLTTAASQHLERFLRPCPADLVVGATHQVTWTDSTGVPFAGHIGSGPLGPEVPIAVRETTLVLWRRLAADTRLAARIDALDDQRRAVLAGTTTDRVPMEIFRVGVEAAGRAIAQHALLAHQTPYRTAAGFARAMLDSGIFEVVAAHWFWELQASTYRRGMIAAELTTLPDGRIRYTTRSMDMLRRMKETTIAQTRAVLHRAVVDEGLTFERAVTRYHDELDLISRQYALLDPDERPRCLAHQSMVIGGQRFNLLSTVARHFVETFARVLAALDLSSDTATAAPSETPTVSTAETFHVPDMSCRNCERTIRGVLHAMDVPITDFDLPAKRVTAEFRTPRNRHRAFQALRDRGYTPVTAHGGDQAGQ